MGWVQGLVKKGPKKSDRFATSRLKPPGYNKNKKPPKDRDDSWKSNKNMFP